MTFVSFVDGLVRVGWTVEEEDLFNEDESIFLLFLYIHAGFD